MWKGHAIYLDTDGVGAIVGGDGSDVLGVRIVVTSYDEASNVISFDLTENGKALVRTPLLMLITTGLLAYAPVTAPARSIEAPDEVTVTAKRLAPEVSKFVDHIAATESEKGLPRWQAPVCPIVLGLSTEVGESIRQRILVAARAARVPLATEPCRPNLFIVVTADPQKLLGGLSIVGRIRMFGDVTAPCSRASTFEIDEFIATPRAIRVWYNSQMTDDWGKPAVGCSVDVEAGGSHISLAALYDFSSVWVTADYTRMNEVSPEQFADYVAMVGLAKIKPNAHLGDARSILKLFDGAPADAPAAMTDWDLAFLKAVYATERKSKQQRGQIAREMVREMSSR